MMRLLVDGDFREAAPVLPLRSAIWEGSAETFIHRSTNGRWRDMLSREDCSVYDERAVKELGADCAR